MFTFLSPGGGSGGLLSNLFTRLATLVTNLLLSTLIAFISVNNASIELLSLAETDSDLV